MAQDWSRRALDENLFLWDRTMGPRLNWVALPDFGLAARSFGVGAMIAVLYVWPAEMMVYIVSGGFRGAVFALVLGVAFVIATLGCWTITALEARHWKQQEHRDRLPEFADPPYWR